MLKKLFICTALILLSGCQSTPVQHTGYLTTKTTYPVLDNRFADKAINMGTEKSTPVNFTGITKKKEDSILVSPLGITRCDAASEICRHGVMVAGIHIEYDTKNISDKQELNLSGVLFVDVKPRGSTSFFKEKLNMKDESGYLSMTVEGYPLLPETSENIRFEGRTGHGEIISIEGPYGLKYEISVDFNNK